MIMIVKTPGSQMCSLAAAEGGGEANAPGNIFSGRADICPNQRIGYDKKMKIGSKTKQTTS